MNDEQAFEIGDRVYERELMLFGRVVRVIATGGAMWYAVEFGQDDTVPCQAKTLELERRGTPEERRRICKQQDQLTEQICGRYVTAECAWRTPYSWGDVPV